jgi:hypothetical protein
MLDDLRQMRDRDLYRQQAEAAARGDTTQRGT